MRESAKYFGNNPFQFTQFSAQYNVKQTTLYYAMRNVVQRFRETLGIKGTRLDIVLFGGALGSMFSFLQFVSSPVIGRLSDKYGRRTVLLVSMVSFVCDFGVHFSFVCILGSSE